MLEAIALAARLWWIQLISGILFLVLGFVVLSYDVDSLVMTAILIGVSFLFTGISWIVRGSQMDELKWWFIGGGIAALIAGIIAFAYPDRTLLVLGLITGWFLLVAGIIDIVSSLANRDRDLWWLGLVTGIVMFGLGAWAVREDERTVLLLVTIVGVYCLLRGVGDLVAAFQLRKVKKELQA
jgi:uncharacterized membrane protein HdeD (DUF308 family)